MISGNHQAVFFSFLVRLAKYNLYKWWFQIVFLDIFTPKLGKMNPFWLYISGWRRKTPTCSNPARMRANPKLRESFWEPPRLPRRHHPRCLWFMKNSWMSSGKGWASFILEWLVNGSTLLCSNLRAFRVSIILRPSATKKNSEKNICFFVGERRNIPRCFSFIKPQGFVKLRLVLGGRRGS